MVNDELKEALAGYAHQLWAGWMYYLFKSSNSHGDGSVTIPVSLVDRWKRQMDTLYEDLPESEKTSDREQADKILSIVERLAE